MGRDTDLSGASILGVCPDCQLAIPGDRLLATYRCADEWPRMLAECPACGDVVPPS